MLPNWYFEIFNRYKEQLQRKNALYLALSAGVDSNTLLHWLSIFKDELPRSTPFMSTTTGMVITLIFGPILLKKELNIMALLTFTMKSIFKIMIQKG